MKPIKLAGLCFVLMLVVGMVLAGNASALPSYRTCQEGATGTKYKEAECEAAESTGKFGVGELESTEKSVASGTLELADTKVPIVGEVSLKCTGENLGKLQAKRIALTEKIENIKCVNVKGCENTPTAEVRNLPWKSEIIEVENEAKEKSLGANLASEESGKEAGWKITCTVLGVKGAEDECVTNKGLLTLLALRRTKGFFTGTTRWLILLEFLHFAGREATCSQSKKETGRIIGQIALLAYRIGSGGKPEDRNLLLF
jgi:hypothetical protein